MQSIHLSGKRCASTPILTHPPTSENAFTLIFVNTSILIHAYIVYYNKITGSKKYSPINDYRQENLPSK